MTTNGLLSDQLQRAEVVNRMHPPTPLHVLVIDGLRRVGRALSEIAEAMLRPEREAGS